jgi:N-acetylglucosaminyl-diphospho-decaprenol L-rhamnosyltransferase
MTGSFERTAKGGSWLLPAYSADVSVILVNYKTPDMLRDCLTALRKAVHDCTIEIVVVDNASADGSAEMVRNEFREVVLIANSVNLGHSGGCNCGMRAATGRYLFLLNTDTRMLPRAIGRLMRHLEAHPEAAAAAPKILNADGTIQGTIKRFPDPFAAIAGRYSLLARLWPKNPLSRRYLTYLDQDFAKPFKADSASAAALMVRREAIARVGPLDERFFLYWNDVDWCRSFHADGHELHCVPDAVLVHDQHKGGTERTPAQSRRSAVDFHRGAYRYFRKWHARHPLNPMNAVAMLGLLTRLGFVLAAGSLERKTGLRIRREANVPDRAPEMSAK